MSVRYSAGVDLGQSNDPTAICVVRRVQEEAVPVEQSTIEVVDDS